MGTLSFDPLIPPALWLALAAAGAALLAVYGWRRPEAVPRRRWVWIMGLSSLGLLLVLGVLLNPTWVEPAEPPAGRPVLTVLVDATASMATPDAAEKQTRYRASAMLAAEFAKQLSGRFDVRAFTFADKATCPGIASL